MGYVTGGTIRILREKRKLTQKELAEIIHVSDKTISKWETDKGLPDISMIDELARALGVSIAELLTAKSIFLCLSYLRQYRYSCGTGEFFLLWDYAAKAGTGTKWGGPSDLC